MRTNRSFIFFRLVVLALFLLTALPVVMAEDDRINQTHHFGGDVLYCDHERGCWLLNSSGELLWEVPQSTIDEVFAVACEAGYSQSIEAGMGTYGPNTLDISCYLGYEPSLTLSGYDEWGAVNSMTFSASYAPVYAPPSEKKAAPAQSSVALPPFPFCPPPMIGTPPDCFMPPPVLCPPPMIGIPPDCFMPPMPF